MEVIIFVMEDIVEDIKIDSERICFILDEYNFDKIVFEGNSSL